MLAELGRAADLFIVEATDLHGETQRPVRSLMTSAEAGRWGAGGCPQAHDYPRSKPVIRARSATGT